MTGRRDFLIGSLATAGLAGCAGFENGKCGKGRILFGACRSSIADVKIMRDFGFHGLHYHDVYSSLEPRICYDPRHPCSPKDSVKWYEKQMEVTREKVGGTQSEGSWDSYAGLLDYCMYVYSVSLDKGYLAK